MEDIRRRGATADKWFVARQKKNLERGANDVVLSLLNDDYRIIMWRQFQLLGESGTGEEEMAKDILQLMKKRLGKGGGIYKKDACSSDLFEVDDDVALKSEYCNLIFTPVKCTDAHIKCSHDFQFIRNY